MIVKEELGEKIIRDRPVISGVEVNILSFQTYFPPISPEQANRSLLENADGY